MSGSWKVLKNNAKENYFFMFGCLINIFYIEN